MGARVSHTLMKPLAMVLLLLSFSLAGCVSVEDDSDLYLTAVFSYSPEKNIRTGDTIEFDASSSLSFETSLTYKWDFDSDGSIDETGIYATWSYPIAGEYEVTLTVSDGSTSDSQSRILTIIDADAVEPIADAGSFAPNTDCDGDSVTEGSYYIFYICEMDKELSSKNVQATMNLNLDGSESDPGASDEYISSWHWDTNLLVDSDGDGDPKNDDMLSGENAEWKDVAPGEYKIALTVTNGVGLTDTDETVVYVNYVGRWSDFEIGGNTSNAPIDMEFSFPVVQDSDASNTIRRAVGELNYPKNDEDCTAVPGTNNCRAKLDLYGFNDTDEEAGNTSATPLDQRSAGDCSSDNDCVWLQFTGSYHFAESQWKDGQWTFTLRNERINDLNVESLTIRLVYK